MAKPVAAAPGAAAPEKKGKKKTFKKKERKHVPHGVVHIQASFNNTIDHFRSGGQRALLEKLRVAWIPRFAQGHALRGAAGCNERGQYGSRSRGPQRGSARERPGIGSRVGNSCAFCRRN